MKLNTTEELIADIRQGRMVVLMDDEDRENEGDLVMAAEMVRPEDINFMAKYARGLICLTLTREHCQRLRLPLMVQTNGTPYATNFTVSIEAAEGVTTGISASDRARTVRVAVQPDAQPGDLIQPGHIFPLMAQPGGVLSRAGHTEAGCDLAHLAGMKTASSVIVEIMNEDGSMARRPDLEVFAEEHGIKIGTIADLIQYRVTNEHTVRRVNEGSLPTEYGEFAFVEYKDEIQGRTHLALYRGETDPADPLLVRVHTRDEVLRDVVSLAHAGEAKWTLRKALERIAADGRGVAILLDSGVYQDLGEALSHFREEPKGRSHINQDSSGAYLMVGTGSQILRDLGVGKMRLMSSQMKFNAISGFGLSIEEYVGL